MSTWNEWMESTSIEPSVQYGDLYLQLTRQFADTFKSIQDKVQVPEAARDFVKRVAGDATARAENIHAGAEKVTAPGLTTNRAELLTTSDT